MLPRKSPTNLVRLGAMAWKGSWRRQQAERPHEEDDRLAPGVPSWDGDPSTQEILTRRQNGSTGEDVMREEVMHRSSDAADLWLVWGFDGRPRVYLRQNGKFRRLWKGLRLARRHWIHRQVAAHGRDGETDDDEDNRTDDALDSEIADWDTIKAPLTVGETSSRLARRMCR